ncbi:hypothetical protein [Paraburkholderia sp. BL6669N2]|uniref:hypothetical protein n=1 Tax=Paraburkholderia sp. BL6669N2 TaxID=1938807 RepID=UPI0011C05BBD|nr:hypothetical protein [Paraburkholderia sp. BL6669N2]
MTIEECLPLTIAIAKAFDKKRADEYGRCRVRAGEFLSVRVSGARWARALLVVNGILEVLDCAGCEMMRFTGDAFPDAVSVDGTLFTFQLNERIGASGAGESGANGEFELLAFVKGGRFRIRSIGDGPKWPIEPRLVRFVASLKRFSIDRKLGSGDTANAKCS